MKATHPRRQQGGDGGNNRRWLAVSAAAAFVVIAGLIASIAMASSPKHGSPAAVAATNGAVDSPASPAARPASSSVPPQASATAPTTTTGTPNPVSRSSTAASGASQSAKTGSLAGRVQPGVTYQGVATEYSAADGDGACLFGPSSDMMIAAMNEADYQNSEACGAHILIHAANGATLTVLITNECPYPCAPGQLDLSQQAFAKIADPKAGRVPITWQLISPGTAGTISVRYKVGSSQWWCGIQTIGERNPVARLEVSTGSGWQQVPRSSYNYFISANGAGCGKAIRITDIYGQQLTTGALPVEPDVAQPTQLQFAQH